MDYDFDYSGLITENLKVQIGHDIKPIMDKDQIVVKAKASLVYGDEELSDYSKFFLSEYSKNPDGEYNLYEVIALENNPDTFQLKEGQCLIIDNIFRIDYVEGEKNSFTFFVSNDLDIVKKDLNKCDLLKDLSKRTIDVGYHQDLVINGLGFIKIVEKAVVDIYVENNVEVFTRDSLI